jgi:hypothetical protein
MTTRTNLYERGRTERGGVCSGGATLRSFGKERISESNSRKLLLDERESIPYDIGVGSTNETKRFWVFIIRKVPKNDLHGGNNLRTPALQ